MKVTNISTYNLYLHDLRVTHASQVEGRPGEDRYLGPGASVYLPNTTEVVRSAYKGDLRKWRDNGLIDLEDELVLQANATPGDTVVLTHNFGLPPSVYVLKQVGPNWVDATGTVDISHNALFTTTTIVNTLLVSQTLLIRLVLDVCGTKRWFWDYLCGRSNTFKPFGWGVRGWCIRDGRVSSWRAQSNGAHLL
jgi:hypothetical protein